MPVQVPKNRINQMYIPLHAHSMASLLDGISKPKDIATRCVEIGATACAITNHGTVSDVLQFVKACKDKGIKPIIGIELYVCLEKPTLRSDRELHHLVLLCKNLAGWQQLMQLVSETNRPECFYYKPRIDLEGLRKYGKDGNFIAITGHLGSTLSHKLLNVKEAARQDVEEDIKKSIHKDWVQDCTTHILELQDIFGKDNVFLESQLIDQENLPVCKILTQGYRYLSKKLGVPCVATPDSHYARKEDAYLQRIMLANSLKKTFKEIDIAIANHQDIGLMGFFKSNNYHIPSFEEMLAIHTKEELDNTILIASMCEGYDITVRPILPKFVAPDDKTSAEYLKELCGVGWGTKLHKITKVMLEKGIDKQVYIDRWNEEYNMIVEFGLEDYFLIVHDIIQFAKDDGQLCGAGRGSAAGSLILYLIGVTEVDPIEYDLLWSRFMNRGRMSKNRVSLPDVDMDFEIEHRDKIIQYIRNKYGNDKVSQISTFGQLKGRAAIADVLRVYSACSTDEIHRITKIIPDPASIADELQEKRDAGEDDSIILWALQNRAKDLQPWCHIKEDGTLGGPLAARFLQAISLEGVTKSQGKHAAGIVVSNTPIAELCPMLYDKTTKQPIAGFDMHCIENFGLVKFDILGVAALSKIHKVCDILAGI